MLVIVVTHSQNLVQRSMKTIKSWHRGVMDPIFEAGQSVLMGCQQKSWVHWWMEGAGVGTVLCSVHIVGTKNAVSFQLLFFFPPFSQQNWKGGGKKTKNKWRETKTNFKICCNLAGGWTGVLSRSLVVWSCVRACVCVSGGVSNFITCHDLLLIYPAGSLTRTLDSSGCRWAVFLRGCCRHCSAGWIQAAERRS